MMEQSIQETSSIGATWPPIISSHNRLRGFYTDNVITGQESADTLGDHVSEALEHMQQNDQVDRVSFRAIAELGSLARLNFENTSLEAVLPIYGTGLGVVYIGANQPERLMSSGYLAVHNQLLLSATTHSQLHSPERFLNDHNLQASVVNPADATDLAAAFTPLYAAFDYDHQATEELLGDDSNIVAYIESDGVVCSTAMAEQAQLHINGYGDLNLVEITEASTHPHYRRKGLYTAISGFLISRLTAMRNEQESDIDVIYGESNLTMPGVIYAAHQNGRRFSYLDREQLGITNPAFGILPQNFTVNDGVESRSYNDFAVSYVEIEEENNAR